MSFVMRRPLACFYVLALLIASGVVVNSILAMTANPDAAAAFAFLGGDIANAGGYINIPWIWHFALQSPMLFGIFVFAAAPTIAALIVAALTGRLGRLLSMLKPWQAGIPASRALGVYAGILAIYALGICIFIALGAGASGWGAVEETLAAVGATGPWMIPALVIAMTLDEGGTLEELGWRGLVIDLLSERYAPLAAAVILGLLWWAWHLPREVTTIIGGVDTGRFLWNQAVFAVLCVALSIVIAFCWYRVGGSVWVGILIHGGTNVWSKAFGTFGWDTVGGALGRIHPWLQSFDLRTLLVIGLALAILVIAGPRLGRAS
jgi:membrane protease YdiL (CAAX protease family)